MIPSCPTPTRWGCSVLSSLQCSVSMACCLIRASSRAEARPSRRCRPPIGFATPAGSSSHTYSHSPKAAHAPPRASCVGSSDHLAGLRTSRLSWRPIDARRSPRHQTDGYPRPQRPAHRRAGTLWPACFRVRLSCPYPPPRRRRCLVLLRETASRPRMSVRGHLCRPMRSAPLAALLGCGRRARGSRSRTRCYPTALVSGCPGHRH